MTDQIDPSMETFLAHLSKIATGTVSAIKSTSDGKLSSMVIVWPTGAGDDESDLAMASACSASAEEAQRILDVMSYTLGDEEPIPQAVTTLVAH